MQLGEFGDLVSTLFTWQCTHTAGVLASRTLFAMSAPELPVQQDALEVPSCLYGSTGKTIL